jgi:hypothetical protein
VFIFFLLIFGPVAVSFVNYLLGDRGENWQTADRSSAGLLPKASDHPDALIRVFAARTVRWRGIFAVHTWIVVKERGAARYSATIIRLGVNRSGSTDSLRTADGSGRCRKLS